MATLVLVHGSFHGPWCWARLVPLLEAAGHKVETPALPGNAGTAAPPDGPGLAAYAAHVVGVIDAIPAEDGPVILVGHSMGGIVSSQVAERRPERIATTIYICGLLLGSGETLIAFLDEHKALGVEDLVLANMEVSPDGTVATFPTAKAPGIFYNTCAPGDAAWAAAQLCPQPTAVYGTPLALTEARFGSVPRTYILGLQDRAVSPIYQRLMVSRTPCEVVELDSDHSPFLSMPEAVAEVLLRVARQAG